MTTFGCSREEDVCTSERSLPGMVSLVVDAVFCEDMLPRRRAYLISGLPCCA